MMRAFYLVKNFIGLPRAYFDLLVNASLLRLPAGEITAAFYRDHSAGSDSTCRKTLYMIFV